MKETLLYIKEKIFYNILNNDFLNFYKKDSGTYISILTNDLNILEDNYINPLINIINQITLFIFTLGTLFSINPSLTGILFFISFLMLLVPKLFGHRLNNLQLGISSNMEKFLQKIKETLAGFEVIFSYNLQSNYLNEFNSKNKKYENSKLSFNKLFYLSQSSAVCLSILCQLFAIAFGGYLLMEKKLSPGSLIAIIQLSSGILGPMQGIINCYTTIKSTKAVNNKLLDILENNTIEDIKPTNDIKLTNSISISNLNFSYNNKDLIIENFSYTFYKNKKYLIIGSSGCGKSTLLKLLSGYFTEYEGNISIDKENFRNINKENLRNLIAFISQNSYLFEKSIEENIKLNQIISKENFNSLLEESKLKSFVDSLEENEKFLIKENGTNLSGGQKQRISIARALIKDADLVLSDEITSSLDNKNAFEIEKLILSLNNSTLISISHKLNIELLEKYDDILVMEEGKLIKNGSFLEIKEFIIEKGFMKI